MTDKKRNTLIKFAKELAMEKIYEAKKLANIEEDKLPKDAYVYPLTIKLKSGENAIGALCNVTFGFGLTCNIVIYVNSKNQLVIRDAEKKHFIMKCDFCVVDYDYDNAIIKKY